MGLRPSRDGQRLAIGVDAGGTWVRVLAVAGERPRARLTVRAVRVPDLRNFLRSVWKRHAWRRDRVAALVVASRGIWTASERRRLARSLAPLAARVTVLADAQAALLGALDDRPGLLVLAGTGSIVVGRDARGQWARAGGLGPLLGDEGSAFWLGRAWLRATTGGEDFLPVRRLARGPDAVARIAALAPRVLARARRGDPRARRIVNEAQAHLARFAVEAARALGLRQPVDVSWAGGLLDDPWFRAGVRRALSRAGLRARWQRPAAPPLEATAALAARQLGAAAAKR